MYRKESNPEITTLFLMLYDKTFEKRLDAIRNVFDNLALSATVH